MEEIRYNLHNHTRYSDGRLSPADVVRANKQKGYNCIAITDHFSVDGIDEAIREGAKLGVTVFPGIELETKKVELLGLFIDHKNPQLRAFLQQLRQYHDAVLRETIEHLNKNGIRASIEEIRQFAGCRAIFNENIIDFLVQKRFAANKRRAKKMLAAVPLNRIKKFFPKAVHSPTIITVAKIIGNAGGIAVLPHAFSYGKAINIVTLPFLLAFMKKTGVKGLETQTPRHGKAKAAYLALLARAFRMQQTGGADLHSAEATELGMLARYRQKKSVAGMLRKRMGKP